MNIIKVKDFDSMQAITVGLARNGYMVTADSVTDENYKDHWEIKYCEFSEVEEKSDDSDWDGDHISSMEIHNKANTKGVKCKILPDEKPLEENNDFDPDSKFDPVLFDEKGNVIKSDEKPLVENEKEVKILNPYELVPRHNPNIPVIPNQDVSDNITDEQATIITSVSGN